MPVDVVDDEYREWQWEAYAVHDTSEAAVLRLQRKMRVRWARAHDLHPVRWRIVRHCMLCFLGVPHGSTECRQVPHVFTPSVTLWSRPPALQERVLVVQDLAARGSTWATEFVVAMARLRDRWLLRTTVYSAGDVQNPAWLFPGPFAVAFAALAFGEPERVALALRDGAPQ